VPFEDPMFVCSFDTLVPCRFFVAFIEFVVLMCSSSNRKRIVFLQNKFLETNLCKFAYQTKKTPTDSKFHSAILGQDVPTPKF